MESLLMSIMVVACAIIMVPRTWRRKVFGYVNLADAAGSFFILGHFAATGAVGGLFVAVLAMLGLTLTLRVGRAIFGSEKLELNGDTSISAVVAGVMTQATRWVRAIFGSLFNGGVISKPQPLAWRWVEELSPVGFFDGIGRFVTTI